MNRTNFEHAIGAILMQVSIALLTGDWLAGACFGSAFFFGREHAQREYHIGDPSKLPPWAALDLWRWTLDEKLDLLFPVVAVSVVLAARYAV